MRSLITILVFSLCSLNLFAQSQGIAYPAVGKGVATTFVTDYHSLGINSSALGWRTEYQGKRFTTGMTEFGMGIYSDSMNVDRLKKLYKAIQSQVTGNEETANWAEQQDYAADYLNKGITMFADYNWGGFAFQNEKFGGIAFNIRENYQWYSRLNEDLTDILFKGKLANYFDSLTIVVAGDTSVIANSATIAQDTLNSVILGTISTPLNLGQISKGSEARLLWNRYYNFGYGRRVFGKDSVFEVYAGIGGRFIQSMAMFDFKSDENGNLTMYSSIAPDFNINYGSIADLNPSAYTQNGGLLPAVVGNGYGIDLSASVILFGRLKIAAAVNNIGKVTYTRNVYTLNDTLVGSLSLNGLTDYNVTNSAREFMQDGGIFRLEGVERHTVANAANFRFGGSLDIGKIAKIGFDMVAPFDREAPGSMANPVFSFGGEVRPIKWLAISAGYFGGGIYRNNIPVGVNFIFGEGTYEVGVSSYDALSFFMNGSNSISAAFGFARVRF
jgi:hypothetical protein